MAPKWQHSMNRIAADLAIYAITLCKWQRNWGLDAEVIPVT